MKTAYFDCFSGISGDMCLGALVDAGVQMAQLKRELAKLPLKGYAISSREVSRGGMRATKVDVKLTAKGKPARSAKRKFRDVKAIIEGSKLKPEIKNKGIAIFKTLFEAEARVHGEPYNKIHLHELGAEDAMVDIMGTLICLDKLGIKRLIASPVNLGSGSVSTAHGELPVPTPATAELMKGLPVYSSGHPYELATPTGAVLLRTLASEWGAMPAMTIDATGIGAGGHRLGNRPNVLRVFIGEATSTEDEVAVVETNIDDMDPRIFEHVMDLLLKEGALDVYLTNIIMKKSRPAVKLTVLCAPEKRAAMSDIILRETTTLGVRHSSMSRTILERGVLKVQTKYGTIRVKITKFGGDVKKMPEYDDLRRAARKHGVTVAEVSALALRTLEKSVKGKRCMR